MKIFCKKLFIIFIFLSFLINTIDTTAYATTNTTALSNYMVATGKTVKECILTYLKCASLSFGIFNKDIEQVADDIIKQLNITKDNIDNYFIFNNNNLSATETLIKDAYKYLMQVSATEDGLYYWNGVHGQATSFNLGVTVNSLAFAMDSQGSNAAYNFSGLGNSSWIDCYIFSEDDNYFYYSDSTIAPLQVMKYNFTDKILSSSTICKYQFFSETNTNVLGWENPNFYQRFINNVNTVYAWYSQDGGQAYNSDYGTYVRNPVPTFVSLTALENYLEKFSSGNLVVDYDNEYKQPKTIIIDIDKLFNTDWNNLTDTIIKQIKKELKLMINDDEIILDKNLYKQVINNYKTIINNNIENEKDVILPSDIIEIIGNDKNFLEQILIELQAFKGMVSINFTKLINSLDFQSGDNIINKSLNIVLEPIFNFQTYIKNFLIIKWDVIYQNTTQEIQNIWNNINIESNIYYQEINNLFKPATILTPDAEAVKEVNNLQFNISLGKYGYLDFNLQKYKDVFGYIRKTISIILWVMYGYSVIQRVKPKLNID